MGKQRTVNSDSIDMDYRIIEYRCSSEDFFYALRSRIQKTEIVLDVGCGIRPQTFFEPKVHICVEPFEEYRKIIRPFFPNSGCFLFLKSDALTALKSFDDDSVDTVMMLDLIEHLEKDAGFELLREANRVARKQIVVFTPLGFFPMHFHGTATDDWGLSGHVVQEHKSGWVPDDFGCSWEFHVCVDCHDAFLPEEKRQGKKYSALMAIKTKEFRGFEVQRNTPQFVKSRPRIYPPLPVRIQRRLVRSTKSLVNRYVLHR